METSSEPTSSEPTSPGPTSSDPPLEIIECGMDGDCLFHTLARALDTDMKTIRNMLASSITHRNVNAFIDVHKRAQQVLHVPGTYDFRKPRKLSVQAVRSIVRTPGTLYQGTDDTLQWYMKYTSIFSNVGFVIFNSYGLDYTQVLKRRHTDYYILLFNDAYLSHWQLVYFKDCCMIRDVNIVMREIKAWLTTQNTI